MQKKTSLLLISLTVLLIIHKVQTQTNWNVLFYDDFNRSELGSNWTLPLQNKSIYIQNNQLCGTEHSPAILNLEITQTYDSVVRISYTFTSDNVGGFETYTATAYDIGTVLAGCDGGYEGQGYCVPTSGGLFLQSHKHQSTPIAFQTNSTYTFVSTWYQKQSSFEVFNAANMLQGRVWSINSFVPHAPLVFELVIGREGTSCIDNFTVEYAAFGSS